MLLTRKIDGCFLMFLLHTKEVFPPRPLFQVLVLISSFQSQGFRVRFFQKNSKRKETLQQF